MFYSFLSAQHHILDLQFIVWAVSDKQTEDCLVRRREKSDLKALFWIEMSKGTATMVDRVLERMYREYTTLNNLCQHLWFMSKHYPVIIFPPCDQVLNVL